MFLIQSRGFLSGARLRSGASVADQTSGGRILQGNTAGPGCSVKPLPIPEALEYRPSLSPLQEAACLLCAAAMCTAVQRAAAPGCWLSGTAAQVLLFLLLEALARGWLLERQYQALQRRPPQLGYPYPNSRYLNVQGVFVHYTTSSKPPGNLGPRCPDAQGPPAPEGLAQSPARCAVHCVHGLGANTFSWSFVQEALAGRLGAQVTAHDIPGLGFTQRTADPACYTLGFNAGAMRAVMDAEQVQQAQQGGAGVKRVLVGHSLGGTVVAEAVIANPEGVSAIVLVAPAVLAWQLPSPPARAQRSKGLGRLLSVWAWGKEPPAWREQGLLRALTRGLSLTPWQPSPEQDGALLNGSSCGGSRGAVGSLVRAMTLVPWASPEVGTPEATLAERAQRAGLARALSMMNGVVSTADSPGDISETEGEAVGPAPGSALAAVGTAGQQEDLDLEEEGEDTDFEFDISRLPSRAELQLRMGATLSRPVRVPLQAAGAQLVRGPAAGRQHAMTQSRVHRFVRAATSVYQAAILRVLRLLLRLLAPLVVLALRRLVRNCSFWELGLAAAVGDPSIVDRRHVDGYRCAQLAQGWDWGLIRFLEARLAEKPGLWESLRHAISLSGTPSQAAKLAEAVEKHHIPVLILHGARDLIVPPANSRRLAALLPGARLVEFEGCGHMPQEEAPGRFVEEVASFLRTRI